MMSRGPERKQEPTTLPSSFLLFSLSISLLYKSFQESLSNICCIHLSSSRETLSCIFMVFLVVLISPLTLNSHVLWQFWKQNLLLIPSSINSIVCAALRFPKANLRREWGVLALLDGEVVIFV